MTDRSNIVPLQPERDRATADEDETDKERGGGGHDELLHLDSAGGKNKLCK